ncbi:MAG: lamin tail domain-containing protein [Candidatus Levybacteria bacterium]|nr:lamin tail domain-containing protein [Candidatus Levybacteria bacterium]
MQSAKLRSIFVALIIFFFGSPPSALASLYINEISSYTTDDWVEIYNNGSDVIDLSPYRIRDSSTSNKLDLSGTINGNSYAVFDWYNKINKSGDEVKLVLIVDEANIIDRVSFGDKNAGTQSPGENQTLGREGDGGDSWIVFTGGSKGQGNSTAQLAPSATPTIVATTVPTHTPSPTRTPSPTKSPSPTKTPSPTTVKSGSTKAPTIKPSPQEAVLAVSDKRVDISQSQTKKTIQPTAILGAETEDEQASQSREEVIVKDVTQSRVSFPIIVSLTLGVIGLACGILIYLKRKKIGIFHENVEE